MAKSSAALRGGLSRSIPSSYRLGRRLSYTAAFLAALGGCSYQPSSTPPNAVVAPAVPTSWKAPAGTPGGEPQIVGARFSSVDIELGQDWSGDVVTSADVAKVVLHTNLFDIGTTRTAPGRFHFLQHVIDDPAFIVRPYSLEVTATGTDGKVTKLVVPFRLRGHGAR